MPTHKTRPSGELARKRLRGFLLPTGNGHDGAALHAGAGLLALRLHRALGLGVYSRADFILDEEGRFWCLEINTLPGMTPTSLVPQEAAQVGLSYGDLCQRIVDESLALRKGGRA